MVTRTPILLSTDRPKISLKTFTDPFASAKTSGAKIKAGTLPLGGVGSAAKSFLSAVPQIGKFLKGAATGIIAGGIIAGGGLQLIPKLFKGAKKGTEIILGEKEIEKPGDVSSVGTVAAAGGVGGLVGAGIALAPKIIESFKGSKAPTPKTLEGKDATAPSLAGLEKDQTLPSDGITSGKPVTPETRFVEAGSKPKKKRRKSRLKARQQQIRQSVRVNVVQRQSNKYKKVRNYY